MTAGFLIGIGGIAYLTIGGPIGAILFTIGLISVVTFGFPLFTGKAGLFLSGDIKALTLIGIWFRNFIGTLCCALLVIMTPVGETIMSAARTIVETRNAQSPIVNCIYGVFCGLLMYIAITGYKKTNNFLLVIIPVAVFILSGYNHCVADMFYISVGYEDWTDFLSLIPTTIGNFFGCNILPARNWVRNQYHRLL